MMYLLANIAAGGGSLMLIFGAISLVNKVAGTRLGLKYLGAVPGDYVTAGFLLILGAVLLGGGIAVKTKLEKGN